MTPMSGWHGASAPEQPMTPAIAALVAPEIRWKGVPWCRDGWYLSSRPSFITDPAWHAGLYYVQEASSMFLEQAFRQHVSLSSPLRVLDACAAPGGKSTHLHSLMGEGGLLVSNEVIRTRVSILSENMQRWGGENVVITSNDPRDFASLHGFFEVIMVDAPCSGSGLFRREPEAIAEWSLSQVQLCSHRQERILSDLWGSLRDGGLLIYSTCSYSPEEDERILDWLHASFEVETLPIDLQPEWGVVEVQAPVSGAYGYRFYPHRLDGEGFFIACLRKKGGDKNDNKGRAAGKSVRPKEGFEALHKNEVEWIKPWIREPDKYRLFRAGETIRAISLHLAEDLGHLSGSLRIRDAGIAVGQLMKADLVPDPGLALSLLTAADIPRIDLSKEQALKYVRKDELHLNGAPKGWAMVTYGGHALGWVKILAGRVNNYYPKQWRVLKR